MVYISQYSIFKCIEMDKYFFNHHLKFWNLPLKLSAQLEFDVR